MICAGLIAAPAHADPTTSLVEDGAYPLAEEILQQQNVRLLKGDGHIVLADCATPPAGNIGLMKVFTTDETIGADGIGRVCFKVTADTGWLDLQIPGVYEIRGDGQTTGTGHEVTATLTTPTGQHIVVDVDPDGSTPVGQGTDPNSPPTMLLQLRTGTGMAPVTGTNPAIGKIDAGGHSCTATLIRPTWIVTAQSCFAHNPDPKLVSFPGRPAVIITHLVPRADRNLVIGRLAVPVVGVTPVPLADTVPAAGTSLQAVGYGRTATTWGNDVQHADALQANGSNATSLIGAGQLCKGDAGAPILNGGNEVVAVAGSAGQAGCLGSSAPGNDIQAARVDDLSQWIGQNAISSVLLKNESLTSNQVLRADANDYQLVMQADGNLVMHQGSQVVWSSGTYFNPGAYALFQGDGNLVIHTAGGQPIWDTGTDGTPADRLVMQPDGNLVLYGPDYQPYWDSAGSVPSSLLRTETLESYQRLQAVSGDYELVMQADGNLVLHHLGSVLWETGTAGHPGAYAVMQADGNLVIYNSSGLPVWDTGTDGTPADRLLLQPDGNLVLYGPDGHVYWER